MSAAQVATAIAAGLPECEADLCPLADGGEGTAEIIVEALGGELRTAAARDPLGRPIEAAYGVVGSTAIVDVAAASGLALLAPDERDPERATSAGTGELILAAIAGGASEVLVAGGGSATVDGGAGILEALEAGGGLRDASLTVLCDVTTPIERAAEMFGPQKGADPAAVERLARRLDEFASSLQRDPRGRPMTGCAGGISGGLWGALGARLVPGAGHVLDVVGVDRRLRRADLVITGEGRLDAGSFEGKLVGSIAAAAARHGVPVHALVGSVDDSFAPPVGSLRSVTIAGDEDSLAAAAAAVVREP